MRISFSSFYFTSLLWIGISLARLSGFTNFGGFALLCFALLCFALLVVRQFAWGISERMSDSVETVNAAAAAIIVAESRVQPSSSVQKRRWGSCWSQYWCFGSQKSNKRVDHAVLVPEPTAHRNSNPAGENRDLSAPLTMPFVAPPSSPASFLRSDPSTAIQSPGGPVNMATLSAHAFSPSGPANIFATGPYAYETQLVSPPVFSAFTTEPSTAAITPPPEPVYLTTPSSPEVPFAQLLTSSLNRARRNSGPNQKHGLSYYEVHQLYSGSPAGQLISPGSVNSTSGTSSPYPVRIPLFELRMADASKLFDSKKLNTNYKWGSRLGSGSLTPDGPLLENQISEVASLANSEHGSEIGEVLVDHRVSFELTSEDIPTCIEKKSTLAHPPKEDSDQAMSEPKTEVHEEESAEAKNCKHKPPSVSLGSVKEFNFASADKEMDPATSSQWWSDEDVEKNARAPSSWTFFPLLQPGVS